MELVALYKRVIGLDVHQSSILSLRLVLNNYRLNDVKKYSTSLQDWFMGVCCYY